MLKAKYKMIGKVAAAVCLIVGMIAPTLSAHVYASSAMSEGKTVVPSTGEVTVKEEVVIEHGVVEIETNDMYIGESYVSVEGQNGVVENTYSVRYEDGEEVSKVLLAEELIVKPVDKVMYVGVKDLPETRTTFWGTKVEKPTEYKKTIDVNCTAYDLSFESCGKRPGDRGYGVTASGMKAGVGVVAVDTRVIPLGTKLYIEAIDGSWSYGYAIAGDTGGAIKGNRVDLFFDTYSECMQFGRRNARVYILD